MSFGGRKPDIFNSVCQPTRMGIKHFRKIKKITTKKLEKKQFEQENIKI